MMVLGEIIRCFVIRPFVGWFLWSDVVDLCAGADVLIKDETGSDQFRYPSYVQHIIGDIFSLGFGPFRCLRITNQTANSIVSYLKE